MLISIKRQDSQYPLSLPSGVLRRSRDVEWVDEDEISSIGMFLVQPTQLRTYSIVE